MYLINLFKKCVSHSTEKLEIYDINGNSNYIFQVLSVDCGKNKKVCMYHSNKVIISNYKHNKLHYSSKYINIFTTIADSKIILCANDDIYIIDYICYKNDEIVFSYSIYNRSITKVVHADEYYFHNKCLIKYISDINGNREYYDFEYEKIDGYNVTKEKVNAVWFVFSKLFNNRISLKIQNKFGDLSFVSLCILEMYLIKKFVESTILIR